MKKTRHFLTLLLALGILAASAAFAQAEVAQGAAEATAFGDAGISRESAQRLKTETQVENGQTVYEVEFAYDGLKYEYWISTATGAIVKRAWEPTAARAQELYANQPRNGSLIGEAAARRNALSAVGLNEANAASATLRLDEEDGVRVYEVSILTEDAEYECEIDAVTGAVYSLSAERLPDGARDSAAGQSAASYIGVDRAKSIAVKHAGMSLSGVTFTKAKLENDDGQKQYEIEFRRNGVEYEYSIHATTGRILDYETDRDEREDDRDGRDHDDDDDDRDDDDDDDDDD